MRDKKIKLSILFIALLMIVSVAIPTTVLAEPESEESQNYVIQNDDILIEVEGGYDGIARLGSWAPFKVKISTRNRDIKGEIQVEATSDPVSKVLFAKPIELSAGGEMVFHFEVPVVTLRKDIIVRVVENKKVLAEKKYSFKRLLTPDTALIGVLSEDPDSFKWLNGYTVPVFAGGIYDEKMKLMIASGQITQSVVTRAASQDGSYQKREAVVIPLSRDTFPDEAEIMYGFDYLFISKFDTGLLSEAQVSTLESWVNTGGVLMLGTGLSWQKVYNGLPDTLKPFTINNVTDFNAQEALKAFTGKDAFDATLKTARGVLGFEYFAPVQTGYYESAEQIVSYYDNDIIVGNEQNPLVLKYAYEMGNILVFSFDPTLEPFISWQYKSDFMENVFRQTSSNNQRFYQYNQNYYQTQIYNRNNFQHLVNEVPSDKKPPFVLILVSLLLYVIIVGPVLYLILKKTDRRDWAWVIIPMLSVVFLGAMYIFGFKTRYTSAVINTVSQIEVQPGTNTASVMSSIGVFSDKRGTLKMEYGLENGIKMPFMQDSDYRYYGNEIEGRVIGKYTTSDNILYEQYNVMLWTPTILNGQKTIPFSSDILKDIYLKDNALKGKITNTTPYDLLDTVIIVGTNIIPIGNIVAGDTLEVNVPLNGKVYKRVQEYLDGEFGRTYYRTYKDYPKDYSEMIRKRNLLQNSMNNLFNITRERTKFILIARNEQVIDYGIVVNGKKPQEYSHNLIRLESDFAFQSGEQVEIPEGIIQATMYQIGEIGWMEDEYSIRINNMGDMEFRFTLPQMLDCTELSVSVESYLPLYMKYDIVDNPDIKMEIIKNKYEYFLYNVKSRAWDQIESTAVISEGIENYIGYGNEVLMKISVIEIGMPNMQKQAQRYESEILGLPEISVKGVAK